MVFTDALFPTSPPTADGTNYSRYLFDLTLQKKCTFSLTGEAETLHEEDGEGSLKWPLASEWLWLDTDNQDNSG